MARADRRARQARPTGEPLLVWALYALTAAAIFATYARTPVRELYHVSGSGPRAAAGRVLVFLNWSTALAAIGTLIFSADRGGRRTRLTALAALVLCAAIFWPGVVDEADLDAKWSNAAAATGVALAFALSLRGARPIEFAAWARGDIWRVAVAVVLVLIALPWIIAELGFNAGSVPVLRSIFYADQMWAPLGQARLHPAVHPGDHHGLDGTLLALTALLLSREIGALRGPRLRACGRIYCAAMLAYGVANVINDAWYEQLVKRGVVRWTFPSMIQPAPTLPWAILLVAVALLFIFAFRDRGPTRSISLSPAWGLAVVPPLVAGIVVGLTQDGSVSNPTPMPSGAERAALRGEGLVFSSAAESSFDVYRMRADGSVLRRLTDDEAADVAPRSSRSQGRIVFQSSRDGNPHIYSMNKDGTGVRQLTDGDAADGEPAWSPDSTRIAFVSDREGSEDIYVMDADGSDLHRLTHDGHPDEWPAWSPDGRSIAFDSDRAGSFDLYVVPARGGTPRRLTTSGAEDRYASWFPDGRRLVFESDRGGQFSLYTLAVDSPAPDVRRLTDGRGDDFGPAPSQDGSWLAFLSDRDGNDQLYVVRRGGSGLARLTSGQADRGAPSWTPRAGG